MTPKLINLMKTPVKMRVKPLRKNSLNFNLNLKKQKIVGYGLKLKKKILIKDTELTLKLLNESFSKGDVIEINPVGEKLDPNFHQAMSLIDSDLELNSIVNVIQKGYKIGDRLVRPALVTVSNGKNTSNKED